MEKLPQLKQSCCGCNITTGTKTIGWVCLILYIFILNSSIAYLGGWQEIKMHGTIKSRLIRTSCVVICFAIVQVIINCVLLLGVCKKKTKFIQAYLIVNFTLLIVVFILLFDNHVNWQNCVRTALALYLVLHTYYFLVVHSYYRTIKDAEGNASSV